METSKENLQYQISNLKSKRDGILGEVIRIKNSLTENMIVCSKNGHDIDRVRKVVELANSRIPKKTEYENMTKSAMQVHDYIETIEIFKTVLVEYEKIKDTDKKIITVDTAGLVIDKIFLLQNENLEKTNEHYRASLERYENEVIDIEGEIYKREAKMNR